MLTDNYGRTINYLRLAVTDKCNLRCHYCMPEEGLNWLNRNAIMTYAEMMRICKILVKMGISKIRITGGEPFARKDIMSFLADLSRLQGLEELTITTNGVLTAPLVPELKKIGIKSVNLSLDTLDRDRFFVITRRDVFDQVMYTLNQLLEHGIEVKINAVIMDGVNTEDILSLTTLTKNLPVSVRFIEEMPFNGNAEPYTGIKWDHKAILDKITGQYPDIKKIQDRPYSTSYNYHIPGHKGTVGVIAAYTRSFCGTCNRIRITADGSLRTCLYGNDAVNIKELLRQGANEHEVISLLNNAITHRVKDGWEAENTYHISRESMATIGG